MVKKICPGLCELAFTPRGSQDVGLRNLGSIPVLAAVGTSNARTTETPQATKYTHFPPYFWARIPPSIWVAQ